MAEPAPEAMPATNEADPASPANTTETPATEPVAAAPEAPADTDEAKKPTGVHDRPSPASAPEPAPAPEIEGKLVSRVKNTVRVKLAGDLRPEKDQSLALLRFFSGKAGDKSPIGALAGIFGGNVSVSGWVSIADVRVIQVDGATVSLAVEKEKTKVVVNGKAVNHFTPGAKLKLAPRD